MSVRNLKEICPPVAQCCHECHRLQSELKTLKKINQTLRTDLAILRKNMPIEIKNLNIITTQSDNFAHLLKILNPKK
jgi:predicted RNase H-like nuclease (RuvC/YqgF family)